jgi:carbon monoxide dehydrogenase subunit G
MSLKIKSKEVSVKKDPQVVYSYLCDLNNFKELLPQDKISNWESKEDYCSFKVQNTATIDIQFKEAHEFNLIHLVSGDKSPFPFTLDIHLDKIEDGTFGYQMFDGKVNPFLKLMVEKPLTNLFNYIADRLVVVMNEE